MPEVEQLLGAKERALERTVDLKEALLTTVVDKLEEFEQEILVWQENKIKRILAQQAEKWYIACQVISGNFDHLKLKKHEGESKENFQERIHNEINIEMDRVQAFINHYKS